MDRIVMIGFGGHAKSMADSIERAGKYEIAGYVDSKDKEAPYPYLGTDDNLEAIFESGIRYATISIGYLGHGDVRPRIFKRLKDIGFELPVIIDPSAIVCRTATLGEGTFVGKNAVVNADAQVGRMVIINTQALVEHDCKVGDYAHVAVAAVLCGQVEVGEAALIGANSTVIQCRKVGPGIIVPGGSTFR